MTESVSESNTLDDESYFDMENTNLEPTEVGDENVVRLALAKMVIVDGQPFSIVDREGFRFFCHETVPQFQIPSRFTVAMDAKNLFNCEREKLKNTLKGLKSRVALTTDYWTSIQNVKYLCLTAHFIDDSWKLHKKILNFRIIDCHKGKDIGKVVEACVLKWGIEDRLSCLTVDDTNSDDMALAVGYLKANFQDKLVLEGELFHMRCACHVLNMIVKDVLSDIKNSITRIRSAIRYVKSSPSRTKSFAHSAMLVKVSCKGSICLDVPTRWNSTFVMLESALEFEKAFDRLKEDDNNFSTELKDGIPTKEDWINAKVLVVCLRQFYETTKRMSGSLYVTSNMHFHEILGVHTSLAVWESSTNSNIQDMGRQMREKFNEYYGDLGKTNVLMLVAVVLDPRYKFKFVKFALKKLFPLDFAKVDDTCAHLYAVLNKLFGFYDTVAASSSSKNDARDPRFSNMDVDDHENANPTNNEKMKRFYDEFYKEYGESVVEKDELNTYLEEVREKRVQGKLFDILQWWKEKSGKYKVLAIMARDILAIPISTISIESAFSTSENVLDQFHSSLGPATVEALVCAQDWLRTSEICLDSERILEDVEKYEEELDDSGIKNVDDIKGRH